MGYVVDTNIFNKLLDGVISIDDLPRDSEFFASHIQIDEINNTTDKERRARLLLSFEGLETKFLQTESMVWDVSRWDQSKWDGTAYEKLKSDLDALNKSKANNPHDALIAEVALLNGHTLLTADRHLADVFQRHGGTVMLYGT